MPLLRLHMKTEPGSASAAVDPSRGHVDRQRALFEAWDRTWAEMGVPNPLPARNREQRVTRSADDIDVHPVLLRARAGRETHLKQKEDAYVPVRDDWQHALEDASVLAAALESGMSVEAYSDQLGWAFRREGESPGLASIYYGHFEGDGSRDKEVDTYWRNPSFMSHAGREIVECSPSELHWVAMDFHARGHRRVFLKSVAVKRGTWTVELPHAAEPAGMLAAIFSTLGETLAEDFAKESRGNYLVQPHVGFHHEMRFFVVDGRIVKAVPVRRADTVFDWVSTGRIEPRSCRAHDGHPSEPDRSRAARYARVARRIIRGLASPPSGLNPVRSRSQAARRRTGEVMPLRNYVLDLGETSDGRVLPIELNGLSCAGYYSCDPALVVRAQVAAAVRAEEEQERRRREQMEEKKRALEGMNLGDLDAHEFERLARRVRNEERRRTPMPPGHDSPGTAVECGITTKRQDDRIQELMYKLLDPMLDEELDDEPPASVVNT